MSSFGFARSLACLTIALAASISYEQLELAIVRERVRDCFIASHAACLVEITR